ncbi:MAG: prepilin-type cleavage/methylation domain-containing protein [Proteobacteria bacterium]|nr:MAG: prepilin-type cleavage/methylation domain-containing protein [Pseudomonadota bacterium]
MRKAFTMIELIFVIVILGILASVAIPKLAATRDDAKISRCLSEISTAITDLGAYYTSQGKFDSNISKMTFVPLKGDANSTLKYLVEGSVPCVKFTLTDDGNVTVTDGDDDGSVCKGIKDSSSYQNKLKGTKSFGGSSVAFD